jgi:hypothetical protein
MILLIYLRTGTKRELVVSASNRLGKEKKGQQQQQEREMKLKLGDGRTGDVVTNFNMLLAFIGGREASSERRKVQQIIINAFRCEFKHFVLVQLLLQAANPRKNFTFNSSPRIYYAFHL